jgi:hypothetical protein
MTIGPGALQMRLTPWTTVISALPLDRAGAGVGAGAFTTTGADSACAAPSPPVRKMAFLTRVSWRAPDAALGAGTSACTLSLGCRRRSSHGSGPLRRPVFGGQDLLAPQLVSGHSVELARLHVAPARITLGAAF